LSLEVQPEERKEALIRISQFVVRDEINKIRDDLQNDIVEMALYWNPASEQGVLREEMNDLIKRELYVIQFPDTVLDVILKRLVENERIEIKDSRYFIIDKRREKISERVQENRAVVQEINDLVFSKTMEKLGATELSEKQIKEIINGFYSFLASVFIEKTEIVARLLTGELEEIGKTRLPLDVLEKRLKSIKNIQLREAERGAILEIFQNPPKTFAKFLFSIIQNLICIKILNLDPLCQKLEREAFSEKILFLDTNVLLGLLCRESWLHKIANDFIKLTFSLGSKIMVTERTIGEYLKVLEDSSKAYEKLNVPDRILESVDDPFISSFSVEKKENPQQSWKGYYYLMKQVESILKNRYQIDIYKEAHEDILKETFFEEIAKQVVYCYEMIQGRQKTQDVAEHDAFHLLLVRELRKNEKSTFLGPNHWFVTADTTLYCVDNEINRKLDYKDKTPSSMMCDIWVQMISPFLSYDVRNRTLFDIFTQLLSSQFITIPFGVSVEDLSEIQGDWLKYDWLTSEDIERILSEEWVKKYTQKIGEAKIARDSKALEELSFSFANTLNAYLASISDEKIKYFQGETVKLATRLDELSRQQTDLRIELSNQQKKVQEQKEKLEQVSAELRSEIKFKRFWRSLSGVLGLIIVFANLVFIWFRVITMDYAAVGYFSISFIIGAVLLFVAIAYEKVKVSLSASTPSK